ncbi:MAG TPA: histidine phosphatase family protein [Acidocella sp.]|jgi:broad specificity phosphatase PhoE|nr:histidine phosphatase family protein [Acidocella sp.]
MHKFWFVRHALVHPAALATLYGTEDVPICDETMQAQGARYAALAARLPRPARFICTPLSRTQVTAGALFRAGYPEQTPLIDPAFIEQDFGALQGLPMASFDTRHADERHPFWPIHAAETPPGGESFSHLITRVGQGMEALLESVSGENTIIVSHGGAIRAACAFALDLTPHQALCLQIDNISLTQIERNKRGWRVLSVNEHPSTQACEKAEARPARSVNAA